MARTKRAEPTIIIGPDLDRLVLDNENNTKRTPNTFHASSIEDCGRQQWYALKGFLPDPSTDHPEWKRAATAGNLLHEWYQDQLLRLGRVVDTQRLLDHAGWRLEDYPEKVRENFPPAAVEVPLPPNPYRIGGRIDAVIHHDNELLVLDIKTVNQKTYDGMPSYKTKKVYAQMQVYMHLTGIRYADILYVSRDTIQHKEYVVAYNAEWCDEQFKRVRHLKHLLDEDILPLAEPSYSACGFCPFTSLCALDVPGPSGKRES